MDQFNPAVQLPLRMPPARVCTSSPVTQVRWTETGVPAAAPLAARGGVSGTGLLLEMHTPFATCFDEQTRSRYVLRVLRARNTGKKSLCCWVGAWCVG